MQGSFLDSSYARAVIAKNLKNEGEDEFVNRVKNNLQFCYSDLTYDEYTEKYVSEGWRGRKIEALYMTVWTGLLQTLYQLSKGLFAQIKASMSNNMNDQAAFKLQSLKHFFTSRKDLQEGFGWMTTFFNDSYGSFYVQEARFHKDCYKLFSQKNDLDSSTAQILATRREETEKIPCPIARDTGRATTEGFYISPTGRKIALSYGEQLLERSRVASNCILNTPIVNKYKECEIIVVNQDCLAAAEEELGKGAESVAVLMNASPIEPGGAMTEGNMGQEEDLCRRSDIFGFMWDQSHFTANNILYNLVDVNKPHQVDPSYHLMTNNRMIHVPQVTVFRSGKNDNYTMLEEPFKVGMLISPPLDRPGCVKENGSVHFKRNEDEEQLQKLIMTQLKVAHEEQYDTVILGAFGCGAFHNPPELVAEFYKKIIEDNFKGAFKKIVFAILDDGHGDQHNPMGNLKPFQDCFGQ